MAVSKASREAAQSEVKMNMTPMIDVTFLLLIFFMCTLHFPEMEGKLASNLPKDLGLSNANPMIEPEEIIRISLSMTEDNNVIVCLGSHQLAGEEKYEQLYDLLGSILQEASKKRVEIDPQPQVPYEDMIAVLDVCRKIGKKLGKKEDELKVMFAAKKFDEGAGQ